MASSLPHDCCSIVVLFWLTDRSIRVYNVLEHKKEADKIVYEDKDPETGFMILPDMKWDGKTLSALVSNGIIKNLCLHTGSDRMT